MVYYPPLSLIVFGRKHAGHQTDPDQGVLGAGGVGEGRTGCGGRGDDSSPNGQYREHRGRHQAAEIFHRWAPNALFIL